MIFVMLGVAVRCYFEAALLLEFECGHSVVEDDRYAWIGVRTAPDTPREH
ncbi:MAG: hypothetical protein QGI10_11915 [Vicinamibacterales bacterium]|nr:hypothetical protein [Vicinamibacterales bacterium]